MLPNTAPLQALLLPAALLAAALCPVAQAAEPVLLPGAPLVAGEPGIVELWAPDLGPDARLRGSSDRARVGSGSPVGDGRWRLAVTPSAEAGDHVTVMLSLKDGDERSDRSLSIPVRPALHGALAFAAHDGVVLGQDAQVALSLAPLGSSHQPLGDRQLLVRSTAGRASAPTAGETGWTLDWRAPDRLEGPVFAFVTVVDAAAPGRVVGWTTVPVSVSTPLSAEVPPGARCTLEAGALRVGPVDADDQGHLALQVDLHPALSRGTLRCTHADGELERALALPAGQDPWLALMPLPPRVPAGATLAVQAVVVEDDGQPRTAGSAPAFAGPGAFSSPQLVASGLFTTTWTAPDSPGKVRLEATLHGRTDVVEVEVVAPGSPSSLRPVQVLAWAEPASLPSPTGSVVVLASALDAVGLPVPRQEFTFDAQQASLKTRRLVAGPDGRAAVRLHIDEGASLPALKVQAEGAEDTALVLISPTPPQGPAGTGPDALLQARASLARGEAVVPTLPGAGVSEARAAAGERSAVQAIDSGVARRSRPAPTTRIGLSLGTVPHAWRQQAVEGDQGLPDDAESNQGDLLAGDPVGPLAIDLRALWLPDDLPLGVDLRAAARQERYRVVGTDFTRIDLQLAGGLRLPVPVTPDLTPYLLVQAEGFRVPLFSYDTFREEDPTKATGASMIPATVIAGRLGGGVVLGFGDARLELEATESFAPWPIHTRFGAVLDYTLTSSLAARASIDLGFRHMRFDLDAEQADVDDQQHFLGLGLVWLGG